ncbi:MAG: fluoride efflux transporter CrcB [Arcobacteraceae bacterium]|nr:fluoride efflux transporter CrcB [Arcobacteraceae bacterium]MDY0327230.1 fluoride efflux transporter CrcB [Arcobacteraceae bacterium]
MTLSWQSVLAIGSGGFLGAVARVYITSLSSHYIPHTIPYGTFIVNILGSFVMGVLFALFMHYSVSPHLKSFLTSGFLGAMTTYSTFAIETFFLFNISLSMALLNISLNLIGTIVAAGIGFKSVSKFLS